MTVPFGREDITSWVVANPEPLGREQKVWVRERGASLHSRERDWLFKPVVMPANGNRQAEDWVEMVVAELGKLLGIPCAEVRLASRLGRPGSISRNVAPDGYNLVLGSVALGIVADDYQEGELRVRGRPGHSPANIVELLDGCEPPAGTVDLDAVEVFAGYLVLDAWVGNQDRHDQNWAVLRHASAPGPLRLASSYDHASSLGFNLLDSRRRALLHTNSVSAYAENGRAHRFEHDPDQPRSSIPTLVRTAHEMLDLSGPRARSFWLDRLDGVGDADVAAVVARVGELSVAAATFMLELLTINRRRLLSDR